MAKDEKKEWKTISIPKELYDQLVDLSFDLRIRSLSGVVEKLVDEAKENDPLAKKINDSENVKTQEATA